jgi:HTH-type transcriptional regulator/antitoxin HigA
MKKFSFCELFAMGVSKSLVSDMLHCRRGLSKQVIRKLSAHFKVSQELCNRPYKIIAAVNAHLKNEGVMNTPKNLSLSL